MENREERNEETEERFNIIVELFRHMCDELVDDPESLEVSAAYTGITGCIEVVGPQNEVSKIFGVRKNTIIAIETVVKHVAAKNGFKILINVLNDERKRELKDRSPSAATPFYE